MGAGPCGGERSLVGAEEEIVPVVAAVVVRGGRYLLGRRPEEKRHGGLWEFPGGKVLDGESHFEAARRELAEELALEVTSLGRLLHSVRDPGAPFRVDFVEAYADGEPRAREHAEVAWLAVDELQRLPLAPADAHFVAWLTRAR